MSRKISLLSVLISLSLLSCVGGCIAVYSSSYGLQERMEVEKYFESGTLLTDLIYYTDGPNNDPDVIIAISKDFQLQSKIWTRWEWTEADFKKVIFGMQIEEIGFCTINGGVLIAPDGQEIGVWYSRKEETTIWQPAPGVVEVALFSYRSGSPCARQDFSDRR